MMSLHDCVLPALGWDKGTGSEWGCEPSPSAGAGELAAETHRWGGGGGVFTPCLDSITGCGEGAGRLLALISMLFK